MEPLLNIEHRNHTRFRFSLNTREIIQKFEPNTATIEERLFAANQMVQANYPLGFIIAPIFIYPESIVQYRQLFEEILASLSKVPDDLTFEFITHRFTKRAKNIILERFPKTLLDLDETTRRPKFGKYGLVKYLYPEPDYSQLKRQIIDDITHFFPRARVEYFT